MMQPRVDDDESSAHRVFENLSVSTSKPARNDSRLRIKKKKNCKNIETKQKSRFSPVCSSYDPIAEVSPGGGELVMSCRRGEVEGPGGVGVGHVVIVCVAAALSDPTRRRPVDNLFTVYDVRQTNCGTYRCRGDARSSFISPRSFVPYATTTRRR